MASWLPLVLSPEDYFLILKRLGFSLLLKGWSYVPYLKKFCVCDKSFLNDKDRRKSRNSLDKAPNSQLIYQEIKMSCKLEFVIRFWESNGEFAKWPTVLQGEFFLKCHLT